MKGSKIECFINCLYYVKDMAQLHSYLVLDYKKAVDRVDSLNSSSV